MDNMSLIEQIKSGKLWDFPGGIHPPENKKQSTKKPLADAGVPHELILPLKQHIGRAGSVSVKVGDHVLKGQPLTQCNTAFTVPIHAPTSGTIKAIEDRTVPHPSGLSEPCLILESDGDDRWIERTPYRDYHLATPADVIEHIRQAGISGMGGAGFPTARKIESGQAKIDMVIINAAECEPYITADDALMREYAADIIAGIEVVEHILSPKLTIIGIEDNKPQAIKALETAAQHHDNIVIRVVPTKYPSGGAKQLIKLLTNQEVPSGRRSSELGQMVFNVGTVHAIKHAVMDGEPLIQRVVTLTGKAIKHPQNVWARLGTPIQFLLDQFGYKEDKKVPRLIMGGPLMGFTLPHSGVPITKISNCILAPTRRELAPPKPEMPCIRCSACADACPASLLPQQLFWHAKAEEYEKCEELDLKDCIECGACAYVCPSDIPLVQYYRQAKAEIRERRLESEAAERAKQRFEAKKARMEREKEERENRHKKAAEQRRQKMTETSGGNDAVSAAIERVKSQKQATQQDAGPKPAVAAAIARAKAQQAEAMNKDAETPDNSEMMKLREERKRQARERKAAQQAQKASHSEHESATNDTASSTADTNEGNGKKDAVAAAVARAKARKQQQAEPSKDTVANETETSNGSDKKDAVAAAVARAKARKQQQAQPDTDDSQAQPAQDASSLASAPNTSPSADDESQPDADPKKAAVAAAIARAKARKQQQAQSDTDDSQAQQAQDASSLAPEPNTSPSADDESQPDADPKKAAVAAAIARAKARKQQQAQSDTDDSQEQQAQDASSLASAPNTAPSTDDESQPDADPKKAAVAAAIARAKARKQQQAQSDTDDSQAEQDASSLASAPNTSPSTDDEPQPDADPKKAAVAAAIARAKARKQQQAQSDTDDSQAEPEQDASSLASAPNTAPSVDDEPQPDADPKKAAVAAAIARAKARKAANKQRPSNNSEEND
ncbi:electron transport complex subunit RsxC [Vibrio palustris]|uniref:Ion-translocating oxidoreductase complex subunit C n=1 Tax=Vibrio palustris TaxID=1918946 RepID=A0A1R4B1J3_9VIBR|nr:electron transport complex subunit RsxC [Vibrio palustris]SJL82747.1 Electron transport complex protein RnfC [Vibrio palustris]